jgi:hypothetical protein
MTQRHALPQWKRDEMAVAVAQLMGADLRPCTDKNVWWFTLAHDAHCPSNNRVVGSVGLAARAFLMRRGYFQCAYTGEILKHPTIT